VFRVDGAIVAWHKVPGKAAFQKSRSVGHGMIGRTVPPDIRNRFSWMQ
jgi:hypothetical protein